MLSAVAVLGSTACEHDRRAAPLRYLAEHEVGQASGRFDGVALAPAKGGAWAVWSNRAGMYARRVDRTGAPVAKARRLGDRCEGGLDATTAGEELLVSCLKPGDGGTPGHASLTWLHPDGTHATVVLGVAGRYSRGIALVAGGARDPFVRAVWHDGSPGAWKVREARVPLNPSASEGTDAVTLSSPTVASEQPALARGGARWLAAWVETGIDRHGQPHGRIVATDGRHAMRPAVEVHWAYPLPVLAHGPTGFVLGVRDSLRGDRRPHLYVQRLDSNLEPRGSPVRAGRADGPGASRLIDCGGSFVSVAPRTWGKDDYFVSLVRIAHDLRSVGRAHEISRYGRSYTRAAAACSGGKVLLLVGERGDSVHPVAALRSLLLDLPHLDERPGPAT